MQLSETPLTTTAYDTYFIASDTAFTDNNDIVTMDIPFRKVKRIDNLVIGMAGCLQCMVDFSEAIIQYATNVVDDLFIPASISERVERDFIAMVNTAGACLKISKEKDSNKIVIENITSVPTVIGSGSDYVTEGFGTHRSAVVSVLEAMKYDKYTDGEMKYCSVHREDIHNLEVHPMSDVLKMQVTGVQSEIKAANDFLLKSENTGKTFRASTREFHVGDPSPLPMDAALSMLKQGLAEAREYYKKP